MLSYTNIIRKNVPNVYKISARSINFRSIIKIISIYFQKQTVGPKPPYDNICQVDDPVLRKKAQPIDTKIIQTEEFQKILDRLYKIMKSNNAVGLAAPQIGLSWQLFAMEVSQATLDGVHPWIRDMFEMKREPLKYFINPKLEIINPEEIITYESCGSIRCCDAEVARASEVQIHALNQFGEPFSLKASGFTARILQHEMDHLKGILFIDRMFPLTFNYRHWEELNKIDGKTVTH